MIGVESEVAVASPAAAPAFNTERLERLPFKFMVFPPWRCIYYQSIHRRSETG